MSGQTRSWAAAATLVVATACASTAPPAMPGAPRFPDVPALDLPAGLLASPAVRAAHESGWRRFQSGDLRRAVRDFEAALAESPAFYPAETGIAFVALEDKRVDEAARRFDAVLARAPAYPPALTGRVEAALLLKDDLAAIRALETLIGVEAAGPGQDDLRSRLDVLRLRAVQTELAGAAAAREAGRLDDAHSALERARAMSPQSGIVLRELARVETVRGALDAAEEYAREAVRLDAGDAEAHATLGEVLEAHGRLREAAAAFGQALRLDPRPEWRNRMTTINSRADFNALPAEFRAIPSAQAITRGQLAALIGSRLQAAIERSPRRVTVVLTDIRGHWSAPWVLPVTRAGILDVLPNHTFQPGAIVRRSDLAQAVWQAIQVLGTHRPDEVTQWRQSKEAFPDVPRAHLAAGAIAAAVASGAMSASEDGRFYPGRPASGAEAVAAVARLEQIVRVAFPGSLRR